MSNLPQLLPTPREISLASDSYLLEDRRLIVLDSPAPQALLFSARRLQASLRADAGLSWEIAASQVTPRDQVGVTLSVVPGGVRHPQGYELTITPAGIHAVAGDAAGVFYAVCTLIQLLGIQLPASSFQFRASSPPHQRLARLPCPRGHAGRQPGQCADDGDALRPGRSAGRVEGQPAPALHRAHLCLSQPSRGLGRGLADHRRGDPGAGRLLPGAFCRAGAQPELVRAHGAVAEAPALRSPWRRRPAIGSHPGATRITAASACARPTPAAWIWCGACSTSCCRISPAGCSTSAATRPWTWGRAAARRSAGRWAGAASTLTFC